MHKPGLGLKRLMNMTNEFMDEFDSIPSLSDDELFNLLQRTRVDLFGAQSDIDGYSGKLVDKLNAKYEYICTLLEERGLDAQKQF